MEQELARLARLAADHHDASYCIGSTAELAGYCLAARQALAELAERLDQLARLNRPTTAPTPSSTPSGVG